MQYGSFCFVCLFVFCLIFFFSWASAEVSFWSSCAKRRGPEGVKAGGGGGGGRGGHEGRELLSPRFNSALLRKRARGARAKFYPMNKRHRLGNV